MSNKTKKRNKRYTPKPKVHRLGNRIILPHHTAQYANLSRPMTEQEINSLCLPLVVFTQKLKDGTANNDHFQHMLDIGYCLVHLLIVLLEQNQLSSDPEYDKKCREEFKQVLSEMDDRLSELVQSIGERHERTGKYGATAQDFDTLDLLLQNYRNILEFVDFKHYFEALNRSQKKLHHFRFKNAQLKRKALHA